MEIDYGHSLVSLISSVMKHFGLDPAHETLPEADALLGRSYKNIVLLLFDGMGMSVLETLPPDSFLRKHLAGTISSVFPPTTTAATTSVLTGLEPIGHGWLGWSSWFYDRALDGGLSAAEYTEYLKTADKAAPGKVVNLYPNTSDGKPAAGFNVAGKFLPFEPVTDKLNRRGIPAYFVSPYSEPRADSVDALFATVSGLCEDDTPKYIYGYSPLPDYKIHDYGISHPKIYRILEKIDAGVEKLCSELTDSLVIVTADHGMVDTEFVFMDDHPEVKECLLREPSIEGRAMSLFIKPGIYDFPERFNAAYGGIYELFPHDEAVKLFGVGEQHPLAGSFVGDYLAVAKTDVSIGYDFDPHPLRAAHGGGTADEFLIPFIVNNSKEI